jgi:hypothetical protein
MPQQFANFAHYNSDLHIWNNNDGGSVGYYYADGANVKTKK